MIQIKKRLKNILKEIINNVSKCLKTQNFLNELYNKFFTSLEQKKNIDKETFITASFIN